VGSLAGAARLLNDNAGVLRVAHEGQKPSVDQKGKCYLEFDFQCEYEPRKRGLSILSSRGFSVERCQKSYHRDELGFQP
jgi:hypothetical protein